MQPTFVTTTIQIENHKRNSRTQANSAVERTTIESTSPDQIDVRRGNTHLVFSEPEVCPLLPFTEPEDCPLLLFP